MAHIKSLLGQILTFPAYKKKITNKNSRRPKNVARSGYGGQPDSYAITQKSFTSIAKGVAPFPFRYDATLTYGVNVQLSTTGSLPTATKYRFSMNSGYDPDRTATGDQPYQWDQMIAIYQYYIVRSAYVDLSFSDPTMDGLWVGWSVHPSMNTNDDPALKTLGQLMERPNYTCKGLNNTGAQIVNLKTRIPIAAVLGLSNSQYINSQSTYGALYSTNPTQEVFLDLFIIDPSSAASAHTVRVAGKIHYDIQFWGYAAPSSS